MREAVMLNLATDVQSLSHFKRETSKVMKGLKKSGRPMVLTVNGKSKVVVQDAESYQKVLKLVEEAEMRAFLDKSIADMEAGRTVPAFMFLDKMARKYKIKTTRRLKSGRKP
jgi:prevent-host-death family protein